MQARLFVLEKCGIRKAGCNLGTAIRTGIVLLMAWVVVLLSPKPGTSLAVPRGEPCCMSILVTVSFSRIVFHE